ncbi:hypothetical protein HHI36_002916 [Cryptolaemus montrouzieri]|uniref:Uncharacterized protein n=1 Tax=Cryptolaemus montrouzieri TaxID=559131 RepID=A0ABD2PCI3_9CUCU
MLIYVFQRNAKLKVLVRSHAMREEQSPPRAPTPSNNVSPCIKLTPSPQTSPVSLSNPVVVLSPSISRGNSPCRSSLCISPTSTLVPSPNTKCSPRCLSPQEEENPQRLRNNNLDRDREIHRNEVSSHVNGRRRYQCDTTQECTNCVKEKYGNNNSINVNSNSNPNTLSVGRMNSRGKLRQQSSSQGSFESNHTNSPSLSRDSSSEQYTDTTGIDLEIFIPETLNRNAKDRALMLRIEQELVNLAKDKNKTHYKFPPMSSYQRMLVHRCAAYFGMEHNIESSGKCVVVNKSKNTRIPCVGFKEHIKDEIMFGDEPRKSILKRDSNSIEDYNFKSPDRHFGLENRRSKSFEEREEEYEKVRKRIFKGQTVLLKGRTVSLFQRRDSNSVDDIVHWSEVVPWSSTDSEASAKYRLQLPDYQTRRQGKLLKVQSEEVSETMRPHVAKSYSFGGYGGVLNRGDSVMSTHSAGPRLLTKQDSAASSVSWRLSPSSSGYKSQSQMSESVTPSPTSTPHLMKDSKRQDSMNSEYSSEKHDNPIVWAVTDIDSVPKGSLIINPQTGQPIKNPDGSLYHYDPDNVPSSLASRAKSPVSPRKTPTSPQKLVKPSPASSPKKKSSKCSPIRRLNTTNSSTSPSLPYSPPVSLNKSFSYPPLQSEAAAHPQQYSMYNPRYPTPPTVPEPSVPLYQQPCIVYGATTYGVPLQPHYEGRVPIETPQMAEMAPNYYMNVPENSSNALNTQIVYQQPSTGYWTQPTVNYFQNQTPNQPRYPLVHAQSTGCLSNYMPASQAPSSNEMVPVYPNHQMQYVYPNPPVQPNPLVFPNQNSVIYTQNPTTFNNSLYQSQQQMTHYPQNTSTPNSCASSVSNTFQNQMIDSQHPNIHNIAHTMAQMNLNTPPYSNTHNQQGFLCNKAMLPFDGRHKAGTPKGTAGKMNAPKGFLLSSSQSSTGTSSPAATVIAGFCPQNPYRTPPETPPTPCTFVPNMNMVFRPMGPVRAPTPGTSRSSRSPTPASDISHFAGQRMSIPPTIYHGMPYMIQHDPRMFAGRGQPATYRQPTPPRQQSFPSDNRSHKGRKSK